MAVLIGNEIEQTTKITTQVYKATHEGTNRLSLRDRSFISFSYGGKWIEDFNLIAIINGDRIQRATYAQFEDITTTYDIIDGQFYWGTHFLNNNLELTLATDGITEQELNKFKKHFAPGKNQELILSETPNRAILARVTAPPVYSLLPFEQKTEIKIAGMNYETSTTVYRGEIGLSFTMDEPFWYARNNIINYWYTNDDDKFGSITGEEVEERKATIEDKDFIKTITEDMIPHLSMLRVTDIILGDGVYVNESYSIAALADVAQVGNSKVGLENYKLDSIDISDLTKRYLFYSGTAPSRPKISFTLIPYISNNYVFYPLNSYSKKASGIQNTKTYNQLTIGDSAFKFTAPDILLGINQAIATVDLFKNGDSVEEIKTSLRDAIKEYYSRAWAMFCINVMIHNNWNINKSGAIEEGFHTKFYRLMSFFIKRTSSSTACPAKFNFDFNTGEMIGRFEIRVANTSQATKVISENDILQLPFVFIEENVGSMIKYNHLIIKDRNFPDENGCILSAQCTPVTTDYSSNYGGLKYLSINFKNLYL